MDRRMRRRPILVQLGISALLASALFAGLTTHNIVHAASGACAALTPSGSYPYSNFGDTLATPTIRGYTIPVCSNGAVNYYSGQWNGYGVAFQCVELVNRFANVAFGSPVSGWGGDAKYHWTQYPAGWSPKPYGSTYRPAPGDIIVWGPVDAAGNPAPGSDTSAPGHVAVIVTVSVSGTNTWSVTAANQNFGASEGSTTLYPYSSGTITKTTGDGLIFYWLTMIQGIYHSQIYGVMHHA